MKPRKSHDSKTADMLADIAKLSQFPRRKQRQPGKFDGARNPREFRFLQTILHRHVTREEVDTVAGASNGPEIVNQLRSRGLEIPCYRLGTLDRDGIWVYRGLYALSHRDRPQVARALDKGKGGDVASIAGDTASEQAATKEGGARGK
jgi:hypothetical protein